MNFKKTLDHSEFHFKHLKEGTDTVYIVTVDGQSFRMIMDEGIWGIWQQVPSWIKNLEGQLADAIEAQLQAQPGA